MTTAPGPGTGNEGARPPQTKAGSWAIGPAAVQLAVVGGLAAAATAGWVRLGEGSGPALAVATGSAAPPALALGVSALRRRPWPAWLAVLGHVGLLAALAAVAAGGVDAAGTALSGGWARLLSTILPAPAGSEVAVLALVVAGVASSLGAELALRSRAAAVPVVPSVLALVATRMATQGVPASRLTGPAVALVLLAGALVMVRAGGLRPTTGVPVALATVLVAATIGPALPWAEAKVPFDPRALRELPPIEAGTVNPLARLRAWQAAPSRVLFRVRLSEPATLRLAVLDRYDGVRFTAAPRFTPAGSALPPVPSTDPGAGAPTRKVTADLVVTTLDGPWVPAPDRPTRVSGPAVAVDPPTGVIVAAGGVRPGQRYRIAATVPTDRLVRLPAARPATAAQVGPAAALPPELPPEVSDLATDAAGDPNDPPFVRLGRLQQLFRTRFREDPASPPGHSLARLSAFLGTTDRVGSTEQLAAAFAVMARSIGFPTRVAVGFKPSGSGEVDVRGGDALAWPEVALTGAGWVPFDPVPPRGAGAGLDRRPPEAEAEAAAAAQATPAEARPSVPGPAAPPPPPPRHRHPRSWWPAVAAAGALGLLLGLGLAGVGLVKARRRGRRRTAPDPGARVRGAWAEASDRLVERGLGRPPSRTPRDAATAVTAVSRAARAPLADLGDLAERAAFGGPGAVDHPDAERAWADLRLLEDALAADDGRLALLGHQLDPRPLASRR